MDLTQERRGKKAPPSKTEGRAPKVVLGFIVRATRPTPSAVLKLRLIHRPIMSVLHAKGSTRRRQMSNRRRSEFVVPLLGRRFCPDLSHRSRLEENSRMRRSQFCTASLKAIGHRWPETTKMSLWNPSTQPRLTVGVPSMPLPGMIPAGGPGTRPQILWRSRTEHGERIPPL